MKVTTLFMSLSFLCLSAGNALAYLQGYEIVDGRYTPFGETARESLDGSFAIGPRYAPTGPDGRTLFPYPPAYLYHSIQLSSSRLDLAKGSIDSLPGFIELQDYDFQYSSAYGHFLEMRTITLERLNFENGFENGLEYWRYNERQRVPVDPCDTAANFVTYENAGDDYPGGIHFTYRLEEVTKKHIESDQQGSVIGFPYRTIIESEVQIGTLVFDATPVPLPASLWLLAAGMLSLAGIRIIARSFIFG